jgi:aspartate carbamoyltransferase catalytic subunit
LDVCHGYQDGRRGGLQLQLAKMKQEQKQTSKHKTSREKVMTVKKELSSLFFAPSTRTIPKI